MGETIQSLMLVEPNSLKTWGPTPREYLEYRDGCLLVAGVETTDRHKIRPDIMLTELTHLQLMRYNAEGREHPELSTTISCQRPLGSRDGTETQRRKFGYLKGSTQQTADSGQDEGNGVATCPANGCTTSQRLRCQADGFDLWTRRYCLSTGCGRPASTGGQYDVCKKFIKSHPPPLH